MATPRGREALKFSGHAVGGSSIDSQRAGRRCGHHEPPGPGPLLPRKEVDGRRDYRTTSTEDGLDGSAAITGLLLLCQSLPCLGTSLTLRRNANSSGIEHLAAQKKRNNTENEGEYKVHRSESTKSLSAKAYSSSYAVVASEDEDVCPTCLEEYTPDNPKIITKCCHHFHLGCIYEWMERSDTCPICGKEMEFCESP
ncbi:E3 ubiquitin-protein ligase ATL4 [Zea mays]|uniref:RING-type E3 ubiquitin transferase n=1 Tax=Zea mays TaxID=4577 RepID=A0A804NY08_MAIZE|nr:E3 ubiquitin-protein ligase ATL4 [Zea mays]|eukprot:XP_008680681.1 E3 ubiquitin-protein ligase ATL4 [Zea mays]